jgi:hypothetical protein
VVVAPATAPATAPVVDRSTPEKALDGFLQAVEDEDRAKLFACLAADPNRPPTMLDSVLHDLQAQARMVHAAGAAFGNGERAQFAFPLTGPRLVRASLALGAMSAQVNGDQAKMSIRFADLALKMLPAQDQADMKVWADKGFTFVRRDDGWHLDLDRTARVVVSMGGRRGRITDPKVTQPALEEIATMMNEIASGIENDQFNTFDQVRTEFWRRWNATLGKYNGSTDISIDLVPVEEGK